MRSDLELLSLLHYNLQSEKYLFTWGLCKFLEATWHYEYIDFYEFNRLKEILQENRPDNKASWQLWWKAGVKKPRITLLRKLIKKYAKADLSNL